jgi:predicted enzyme related to lactoylglutathione lyase
MNPVIHFELPADNVDRAKKFYGDIFDWKVNDMPEMNYAIFITTETDEKSGPVKPGEINGGLAKRGQAITVPSFAISVPDIDVYLKKITAAGGKVLQPKTSVGGMGFMAYFSDPEGNVLSLWQNP